MAEHTPRAYEDMTPEQRQRRARGYRAHWTAERRKKVFLIVYSTPEFKGNRFVAMQKAGIKEKTLNTWVKTDPAFARDYAAYQEAWGKTYADQLKDIIPDAIQATHDTIRQSKDWRSKINASVILLKSHDLIHDKGTDGGDGATTYNDNRQVINILGNPEARRALDLLAQRMEGAMDAPTLPPREGAL